VGLTDITRAERVPYWREVARLGVQAAEALAHAHRQGVLHRDVKPSNLLLDEAGTLWVADFGLAKVVGSDDLTGTGDVVGTLRYMAPERFRGQVDARSDIYSLGLTLYELLAERPAYEEQDRVRLIERISQGPAPPRPCQVVPAIPRDLETIVLKASDREPGRRYQHADELADDLRRFLADQPIRARRVGVAERCLKQVRRHPMTAGLIAALLFASLTALGIFIGFYLQLEQTNEDLGKANEGLQEKKKAAEDKQALLLAALYQSTFNENEALLLARNSGWRRRALDNLRAMAAINTPQRDFAALRRQASDCLTGIDVLPQPKLRQDQVRTLVYSPDGQTLYVVGAQGILAYDASTGEPGQALRNLRGEGGPPPTPPSGLWCHPLGHYLVSTTPPGNLHFFAGPAGVRPADGLLYLHAGRGVAFDRRGDRLAVTDDKRLTIYDAGGQPQYELPGSITNFALHPDGQGFAAVHFGGQLKFITVGRKDGVEVLDSHVSSVQVRAVHFSPDGSLLAAALTNGSVLLWQNQVGSTPYQYRPRMPLRGHVHAANALAFSADSRYLATVGDDRAVCLWDPWADRLLVRWDAECGPLRTVAFSPEGQTLAVGGLNGARRFTLQNWQGGRQLISPAAELPLAFHPQQPWLATTTFQGRGSQLRVLDRGSLQVLHQWAVPGSFLKSALWFSPEGDRLAGYQVALRYGGPDAHTGLTLWDTATGKPRHLNSTSRPTVLAFDPNGGYLAWASDYQVHLWDRAREAQVWAFPAGGAVDAVAFCPATSQVVVGKSKEGLVVFHDLHTGKEVRRATLPVDRSSPVVPLAIATAGRRLAFRLDPQQAALWEFPGLKQVAVFEAPARNGPITSLFLSPGGRYLAIQQQRNLVTVWETQTRQPLLTVSIQGERLGQVVFSPDEKYLACVDGNVRLLLYDLLDYRAELGQLGIH
jgi:WD40 repeat protein